MIINRIHMNTPSSLVPLYLGRRIICRAAKQLLQAELEWATSVKFLSDTILFHKVYEYASFNWKLGFLLLTEELEYKYSALGGKHNTKKIQLPLKQDAQVNRTLLLFHFSICNL